jgi:hypothetical protein
VARHRNLAISLFTIVLQAALTLAVIAAAEAFGIPDGLQAAGAAFVLMLSLGLASVLKARLLCRLLGARVQGWRWPLAWAAGAAALVGSVFTFLPPRLEWLELSAGIPAILATFGWIVWKQGFTREDRILFRMAPPETPEA